MWRESDRMNLVSCREESNQNSDVPTSSGGDPAVLSAVERKNKSAGGVSPCIPAVSRSDEPAGEDFRAPRLSQHKCGWLGMTNWNSSDWRALGFGFIKAGRTDQRILLGRRGRVEIPLIRKPSGGDSSKLDALCRGIRVTERDKC